MAKLVLICTKKYFKEENNTSSILAIEWPESIDPPCFKYIIRDAKEDREGSRTRRKNVLSNY